MGHGPEAAAVMVQLRTAAHTLADLGLSPLGLGATSVAATQISLPPGATIALYTDGLVESRTRPIDDGLAALCGALDSALARDGGTLDEACQSVTQELRQQGEDDIMLVLARIRQEDGRDKTA